MKRFIQRFFIFLFLVVFGYLFVKLGIVAYERYALRQQINEVMTQVEALKKSNEELQELLAQLGNREFLKLTMKEQLNVKEEGEEVVVVKSKEPPVTRDGENQEFGQLSHWRKWWELFFK